MIDILMQTEGMTRSQAARFLVLNTTLSNDEIAELTGWAVRNVVYARANINKRNRGEQYAATVAAMMEELAKIPGNPLTFEQRKAAATRLANSGRFLLKREK